IKSGTTIFGVEGDSNVVNTSSGDALAAELMSGKKAWVDGAEVTGTIQTQTLANNSLNVPVGFYTTTTLDAVDSDLTAANIKSGATIFGVEGDSNVVNTSSGDALAAELMSGKKAWVDGAEVTGTIQTQTLANNSLNVPAGFYTTTTLDAVDSDLTAANIKNSVNIFGITGTLEIAPVPKTGQTTLYVAKDDGDLEKGVAWPSPRFTDNSNGTVTDNLTGLIWLKKANAPNATRSWANALIDVNNLNTTGFMNGINALDTSNSGTHQTDWRLPNIRELHSLIDYSRSNPALPTGHPFTNVINSIYWTSTTYAVITTSALNVTFASGLVSAGAKTTGYYVWPVRGGQ
ncbi:MAG: DUF1566 domain-containing protein, partial [Candidatus Riflebacteria bacterium]|nr:DUF1566 domain-containing protein [Candidatus Riflebacteria bacterium]